MKMASFANILVLGFAACYFSTSLGTGLESNLDENKLRLIRGRRDENGIRLDSFDGMSINEKTSNDYSTLYEYSSLDVESPVSENSISNAEMSNNEVENSLPASYFEGGSPIDENRETENAEFVDNLGAVKYGENDHAGNNNIYGPNHAVMSNCPPPNVTYNGSLLSSGEESPQLGSDNEGGGPAAFKPGVQEVEFKVRVGFTHLTSMNDGHMSRNKRREKEWQTQNCKIVCKQGQWIGPLCRESKDKDYVGIRKSCELNLHPPHMIITYQYQDLKLTESTLFPDGTRVYFRCEGPPGLRYSREGNASLSCNDGRWSTRIPFCRPTPTRHNFSEDLPPRIRIHRESGYFSTGSSGELLVYPGAIIHIDCLYHRNLGNPEWILGNSFENIQGRQVRKKPYPTGWSVDGKDWQFRLSIYYATQRDTNSFICRNPRGLTNTLSVEITDIECPPFNITDIPESRLSHGYKIGTEANFTCPRGFELIGQAKLTCLSNGEWSADPPRCSPIRCVALEILDAHLRVLALNNTYRGSAKFLCPFGYRLVGPDSIKCGHEGRWTGSVPSCRAIQCPPPLPPTNGRLLDNGHYLVGNTVQYFCKEGFVLIGEPVIRCTESGLWSHAPPFCKRACRFPGDPKNGRVTPVKFLYELGDRILIQCNPGYVNMGRQRIQCSDSGKWSDTMPTCFNYSSP